MKSIIFNQHQVNYALRNKEGMFRVVVKPYLKFNEYVYFGNSGFAESEVISNKSPYQVKETIFVKETWGRKATGSGIAYKVDNPNALIYQHLPVKWKLAQHMKQEHSRLTLRIKSVKVERLQDITPFDCAKEGIPHTRWQANGQVYGIDMPITQAFGKLWNSTHKKPEEKWEGDPFCFVYEYEVVR